MTDLRTGAVTRLDDPPLVRPSAGHGFRDRRDAGLRLAALLERFRAQNPVVIAMPRGGVPVAAEIARSLSAPLDVVVVRKIGAPANPEFAIGALAEGGAYVLSEDTAQALGLTASDVRVLIERTAAELADRTRMYRGSRAPVEVAGRTVILVDDGLATGRTALAAIHSLRARGAGHLILAVPVAAPNSAAALSGDVDEIVAVELPEELWAVGLWYEDFPPTSDEEVIELLERHGEPRGGSNPSPNGPAEPSGVAVPVEAGVALAGDLAVPDRARGLVIFAHGSGSSRRSARNREVAGELVAAGYATFLFDLLTEVEAGDRENVFDIPLLARRLVAATEWTAQQEQVAELPLAYFGASTGAAAALSAAAQLGERVCAVISRGGRPDMAAGLPAVRAATLLIVGGDDELVLELNRDAQTQLRCASELAIVPGAGHLFEEPGAMRAVIHLAIDWLGRYLTAPGV